MSWSAGRWSESAARSLAEQLTDQEVRALTAVEDEESATLSKMPAQLAGALGRRRRGSV